MHHHQQLNLVCSSCWKKIKIHFGVQIHFYLVLVVHVVVVVVE